MNKSKEFLQKIADEPPPCTNEDPELFFPDSYSDHNAFQIKQAKKVCRNCPLAGACLEFALDTEDGHGILGGTTPAERTDIHQRRLAAEERTERRVRKYQRWNAA